MAVGEAYKRKVAENEATKRRLERARREALARVGCLDCGASKDEIRGEQARLRAEMYARLAARNGHTNEPAAAPTASGL